MFDYSTLYFGVAAADVSSPLRYTNFFNLINTICMKMIDFRRTSSKLLLPRMDRQRTIIERIQLFPIVTAVHIHSD